MIAFKKILVPTNFSPASAEAFRIAVALVAPHEGEVVVVHVTQDVAVVVEHGSITAGRSAGKDHNLWDDFRSIVSNEPNVRITHEVVAGKITAAEIVAKMEKFGCDLIVIGSHGHGRFRRLLRGSLTDQVIRSAHCPVLVVRAPTAPAPVAKPVSIQSGNVTSSVGGSRRTDRSG
jgi:nucleotide-binding universal stress UspA family protein